MYTQVAQVISLEFQLWLGRIRAAPRGLFNFTLLNVYLLIYMTNKRTKE